MGISCVLMEESGTVLTVMPPVERWDYEPQKDITAYEAACVTAFVFSIRGSGRPDWSWLTDRCGETVLRHFRKVESDGTKGVG